MQHAAIISGFSNMLEKPAIMIAMHLPTKCTWGIDSLALQTFWLQVSSATWTLRKPDLNIYKNSAGFWVLTFAIDHYF